MGSEMLRKLEEVLKSVRCAGCRIVSLPCDNRAASRYAWFGELKQSNQEESPWVMPLSHQVANA